MPEGADEDVVDEADVYEHVVAEDVEYLPKGVSRYCIDVDSTEIDCSQFLQPCNVSQNCVDQYVKPIVCVKAPTSAHAPLSPSCR